MTNELMKEKAINYLNKQLTTLEESSDRLATLFSFRIEGLIALLYELGLFSPDESYEIEKKAHELLFDILTQKSNGIF